MISAALFRSDSLARRLGLWLVAFALLLQVLALPLANRHQLSRELWESGAQTIAICTAHGLQNVKVGADGSAKPDAIKACEHCVLCLAAGLAFVPVSSLLQPFLPLLSVRQVAEPADITLAQPNYLWPPALAPPAR